ncbi:2-isopropylmalate synthase [Ruficoccus amylovorans]|uniref:2-isopropylmalate synthase n=1 Tax=Ruficoccus amylovorans TaxID=1804625 RepID=A0A842HAV4_9BACT|nr:2-isopropylmalate synthase [Ruficoccus amylovorans]MBC2593552.1 2-isopropylmalate synthase [Ruficoccus amylovorans]
MKPSSIRKYVPFHRRFSIPLKDRQWPDRVIEQAPIWCSVDLRDGNQALAIPMNIEEKLEMFRLLVQVGFKQIEVGFPSASQTEFDFLRRLVEQGEIPDDVQVQILVQAREHLIRRSFEALKGVKRAIVHLYNSTSPLQRKITFSDSSKDDIKAIAVKGAQLVRQLADEAEAEGSEITMEYSPESFNDTEIDYAIEICEAVMDVWKPTVERRMILNLPATVEWTTPNVHADQIEYFCRTVKGREKVWISLHTHNDRGTGVAATELGLLAGADRVEGTLFGNGERTGNLDIVNVALNMNSHGIDTGLDFSNLPHICEVYERCTRMSVHERHPYGGELVFTAFSGSHQDAIKKGLDRRKKSAESDPVWEVPYLTIDPEDLGRTYEAIIRINSQSGKGGVAYIMDTEHGLELPKSMHPEVGKIVNDEADRQQKELNADEIREVFEAHFVNLSKPLSLGEYELFHQTETPGMVRCIAQVVYEGKELQIEGTGNGPISAFVDAIEHQGWKNFRLTDYRSHSVGKGSASNSAAYIQLQDVDNGRLLWGCGIDTSIEIAGLKALVSAFNRLQHKPA